jgi:hypothetical protein
VHPRGTGAGEMSGDTGECIRQGSGSSARHVSLALPIDQCMAPRAEGRLGIT